MDEFINIKNVVNAIVFSMIGLGVLTVSFIVFDRLTPGNLWKEIVEEKNVALAIATAAMTLAIAHITAAAIHG